jgi:hypothetical protein
MKLKIVIMILITPFVCLCIYAGWRAYEDRKEYAAIDSTFDQLDSTLQQRRDLLSEYEQGVPWPELLPRMLRFARQDKDDSGKPSITTRTNPKVG